MSAASTKSTAPIFLLGAVVFLANSGLLVLQLVGPRYLAPFIGSSVETWTSVIGVFLVGIAIGNHLGGKIADRSASTRTLGKFLILGAITSALMIVWWNVTLATGMDRALPLGPRIPILAAIFCLPPAIVLSLITPLTIKLMLSDVTRAGRVAGLVFALSTIGCLIGNYATGFWFLADFTLNTITAGVTIGLLLLAVPMFLVKYQSENKPQSNSSSTAIVDDPLGFRQNIRKAYAVVFLCSFCGMSLELTASRLLAPILGWSLYSWTGIIGVMLAGTACGNYLGGVIADRGRRAGLERFSLLMGILLGFAAGPAFLRSILVSGYPEVESEAAMYVRIAGAGFGLGIVVLVLRLMANNRRPWLGIAMMGAVLGYVVAHPVTRSVISIINRGANNPLDALENLGQPMGLNLASIIVHTVGAAVGAAIALGLGYDPKEKATEPTPQSTLGLCVFGAALFTGLVVIILGMTQKYELGIFSALFSDNLVWNVLTVTFLVFFLPMLCLGTISPQVIRLSIPDEARAGRTAGTVYAWSTAGAIVGTFAAGYLLIELLGMNRVVFMLGVVLILLSIFLGRFWKNPSLLFGASILFAAALVGMFAAGYGSTTYTAESKYYAIRVFTTYEGEDEERRPYIHSLALDHLTHSAVKSHDPSWLYYPHEYIQGELTLLASDRSPTEPPAVLVIGGGGYTFPRWVEMMIPRVSMDVVEIDPAVTEVAHSHLGLSRNTKIRSIHMDGRQFVREKAKKKHYQLVMQDAVNDLAVPYHLMTKEYNDAIKETLAPDGAYLLTIIDSIEDGDLWRAAVNTMRQSFKHVEMLDPSAFAKTNGRIVGRHVYIIYGSDSPFPLAEVRASAKEADARRAAVINAVGNIPSPAQQWLQAAGTWLKDRPPYTHVLDHADLEENLARGRTIILTDQFAPTDDLMKSVFRNRNKR